MKRTAKWMGALVAIFVALLVGVHFVEKRAEDQARSLCNRFPSDSSFVEAQRAAKGEGDARHRRIASEEVAIAYIGIPPFSRHMCIIKGSGTKVVSSRYVHID
jgi:hypothetical protein